MRGAGASLKGAEAHWGGKEPRVKEVSKLGKQLGWEGMVRGIICAGHGWCQKGTALSDTSVMSQGKERCSGMLEKAKQVLSVIDIMLAFIHCYSYTSP